MPDLKHVLFVCSQNRLRSPTAERVFSDHPGIECASAGTNHDADHPLTPELIEWADIIFVMEPSHRNRLGARFKRHLTRQRVICLDIPDEYDYMDSELVRLLRAKVTRFLPAARVESSPPHTDAWASGDAYEPYVGRWSRLVAREFLGWLDVPAGRRWLDVGCGTGALSHSILEACVPRGLTGVDRSDEYVAYAREHVSDPRARFEVGDAQHLPVETGAYDAVVSGLALNFIPDPARAVAEMGRAASPGGLVAMYVWDYAGRMELMRHFWDAAAALDPDARELDEGRRFPICHPGPLAQLFRGQGFENVAGRPIEIATRFRDFDDFWTPFLGGQGPAPGYARSLNDDRRGALRERIRSGLPFAPDGSIPLVARAWAVRGSKP